MTLADWPNMKDTARRKLHKKVYSSAYPEKMKHRAATLDDLEKILGAKLHGR